MHKRIEQSVRRNVMHVITAVRNKEVTSYRVAKATGVSRQLIDMYAQGAYDIDNMKLKVAETLSDYYEGVKENGKM